MRQTEYRSMADDGTPIFTRRFEPESILKGTVLIAHGVAEHGGRYQRLAERLAEVGWASVIPDHRGHGRTAEASGGRGSFAESHGFYRVLEDLHSLRLQAEAQAPGKPLVLLGHSMGSSLARGYLCLHGEGLAGCAISGIIDLPPLLALSGRLLVTLGLALAGGRTPARLLDRLTLGGYGKAFKPNRTPLDWLSRDSAEVDAYAADPDCGFVCSWSFFRDMREGMDLFLDPARLKQIPPELPVYIFAGAEDPVGAVRGGVERLALALRAAGLRSVRTRLYPEARHEVLKESNREEVMDDLVAWLELVTTGTA